LTGDAGRGCGDASRAPNFSAEIEPNFSFRPTNRPTFEDGTSTPAPRLEALEIFVMRSDCDASASRVPGSSVPKTARDGPTRHTPASKSTATQRTPLSRLAFMAASISASAASHVTDAIGMALMI